MPALAAKPVIDVIVLVAAMEPARAAIPSFVAAGYEFRPDASDDERLFLRRFGPDGVHTHHLHIHIDTDEVRRDTIFRDRLRADADLRREYEALKHDLAVRHADDRWAYAPGKTAFVDAVVLQAGGPRRRVMSVGLAKRGPGFRIIGRPAESHHPPAVTLGLDPRALHLPSVQANTVSSGQARG